MNFRSAKKTGTGLSFSICRLQSKHKTGITLLLFFAFFSFSLAQETPPLTNYSSSVYKAHKQNWAIDQSMDGIIYAANSDGLLEYDGASWKLYSLPNQQIIRAVLCDDVSIQKAGTEKNPDKSNALKDKRIYVGGYGEFGYWQPKDNGQLNYYS